MGKELICSKCSNNEFTRGMTICYTSIPGGTKQDYICSKCGHIESITTWEEHPKPSKVFIEDRN